MAVYSGTWVNPHPGHKVEVYEGFSWWTLFAGVIYYAYKGMWKWFVVGALAAMVTAGLAGFYLPFKTHQWHRDTLRQSGYKPIGELDHAVEDGKILISKGD